MGKKDIKNYTLEELKVILAGMNEPAYKAGQIFSWLYRKNIVSFTGMANIPKPLAKRLDNFYYISALRASERLISGDKTEKFLFKLRDGNYIETVLLYAGERKTLCLSTQVGCKFACSFCASGHMGFIRDLTPSEIVGQILCLRRDFKHGVDSYVFMGMGEPLDNYDNTSKAIFIMNDKSGLAIGARRITVSTCGIIPGIDRIKELGLQINLSVSLHAANDQLRNELVPVNKRYPIEELIGACQRYFKKTGRVITLEYVLIKGRNHSPKDADRLAGIAKRLRSKVNLIVYSGVAGLDYEPPGKEEVISFMDRLKRNRINVTLRRSRGQDIQAACGQLAGKRREDAGV